VHGIQRFHQHSGGPEIEYPGIHSEADFIKGSWTVGETDIKK